MTDNKVTNCGGGLWLYGSSENYVANNRVHNNDYGIRVETSSNNQLLSNIVTGNWGGLWLISAVNNILKNNTMMNNARNFGVSGDQPSHYLGEVDSSNTVDGKPVYWWINKSSGSVPSDAGCIVLANSQNVLIQGLNLRNNQNAIVLVNSQNVTIQNNAIEESNNGIVAYNSVGDRILGNTIKAYTSIDISGNGTTIANNIITGSIGNAGIRTNGSYNTLVGNDITFSTDTKLIECYGNFNNISRNSQYGSSYTYTIIEGNNNTYYENLMRNSYQVRVKGNGNIIAKNDLTGITLSDGAENVVCANRITNGLGLAIGGSNNLYYGNHIENNYYVGADIITKATNKVYHNNFVSNKQQVKDFMAKQNNIWDNGVEGNYWSDYNGTDLDGNGIGDTPYFIVGEKLDETLRRMVEVKTGQDNFPLMLPFDITSVTITLPQWNYSMPTALPSPTLMASPTVTPITTPTLTHTSVPTIIPTVLPSETSSATAVPSTSPPQVVVPTEPEPQVVSSEALLAIVGAAAIGIIAAALLVLRKRKK